MLLYLNTFLVKMLVLMIFYINFQLEKNNFSIKIGIIKFVN